MNEAFLYYWLGIKAAGGADSNIPDPPTENGTYYLCVTVSNGEVTYSWVKQD